MKKTDYPHLIKQNGPTSFISPIVPVTAPDTAGIQPATPHLGTGPRYGAVGGSGPTGYNLRDQRQQQQMPPPRMHKHASDAGLAGVAEAAGHVLGELAPVSSWRQEVLAVRLVAGLLLAVTLGYALLFAPRKLGFWGELHLVLNLCSNNALSFALFNMLGVFPALLACVAWPVLRNEHPQVKPMRPYIIASFAAGAFALLSHIALWDPPKKTARLPPKRLSGRSAWLQQLSESRLLPAVLLASTLYLYIFPFIATPTTWAHFGYLATHSWTLHVMLMDFTLLILLSPWLVLKDASARNWGLVKTPAGRWALGLVMVLAPAVGPGVYLMVRPVSEAGGMGLQGVRKGLRKVNKGFRTGFKPLLPGRSWLGFRSGSQMHQHEGVISAAPGSSSSSGGGRVLRHGGAAARAADVAAAAAVPLPTAFETTSGAVGKLVRGWWHWGLTWLTRGGVTPEASSDEADMVPRILSDRELHDRLQGLQLHGSGCWELQQQQQPNPLGPGPAPAVHKPATGGLELLFTDDYEEYEAGTESDTDISDTASDTSDDPSDTGDLYSDDLDDVSAGDADYVIDDRGGKRYRKHLLRSSQQPGGEVHYKDDDSKVPRDEEEEELFGELVPAAAAGGGYHTAAAATAGSSRPAKEIALERLAELAHQEHPKMAVLHDGSSR